MTNASKEAAKLLTTLGRQTPGDMSIEDMAWAKGLTVIRKEMDGSEGRILMNEREAIITINQAITYQPKINFILAHEIGHAVLHRNKQLFSDSNRTLNDWYANGPHEREANTFATELLLPSGLFEQKVKNKKLELELIESTADYFGASKTATFLRYKDLGDYPLMIIFIEKGFVKWKTHSTDFPFKWLPNGTEVPPYTVAGDLYYKNIEEKKPDKVDAFEWFPDDYQLHSQTRKRFLWEQCFRVSDDAILTCIWCH
jgi:Zn-dependent peptidase ImmA (M78 family)